MILNQEDAAAMELELHQQMGFEIDQNLFTPNNNMDAHLMHYNQEMNYNHCHQIQEILNINNRYPQSFDNSSSYSLTETNAYPPTQDFLNIFHLPNSTHKLGLVGDTSTNVEIASGGSSVLYDPMFHLNLPPQPPMFRDLYNLPAMMTRSGSLFGGVEEVERSGEFENGVLEFHRGMNCLGKGKEGKDAKHFATEKQRREQLGEKYNALKALVPISTRYKPKPDRASIVGDAIRYINELQRTVNELNSLVEKKRYGMERIRRQKKEDGSALEVDQNDVKPQINNGSSLRSSWLQRKSKNTEVDVRIIDDEVTIKFVQQKRINCLLLVSKVLDELQLALQHVSGGVIGDFYSFLFNSKICEGSSVYASAIANKLIEVVDRQYAAASQPSSY